MNTSRRSFVRWTLLGWALFVAALAGGITAVFRMIYPNVSEQPPTPVEFNAGPLRELSSAQVDQRFKDDKIYLVHDGDHLVALVAECSKDGCIPNWRPDDHFFECPCCGSTFSREGINLQGAAPWPLERAAIRIAADGTIRIDLSTRFRYEKGEWNSPNSFVKV